MECLCGIPFIVGLVFAITGRFRLGNRVGARRVVRLAGGVLMLPFVLAVIVAFAIYIRGISQNAELIMNSMDQETGAIDLSNPTVLNTIQSAAQSAVESSITFYLVALLLGLGMAVYLLYRSLSATDPVPAASSPGGTVPVVSAPDVMTIAEAAAYLRITEADVRALIDDGKLPAARIGGSFRIAKIAIQDFLKNQS